MKFKKNWKWILSLKLQMLKKFVFFTSSHYVFFKPFLQKFKAIKVVVSGEEKPNRVQANQFLINFQNSPHSLEIVSKLIVSKVFAWTFLFCNWSNIFGRINRFNSSVQTCSTRNWRSNGILFKLTKKTQQKIFCSIFWSNSFNMDSRTQIWRCWREFVCLWESSLQD